MAADRVANETEAASRRQRRLREWLRHERLSVAMAQAESQHHAAPRGPKMARAGREVRVEPHGEVPVVPGHPVWVSRGGHRWGVQRHTVEQMADVCPFVQILDDPVPQMENLLLEVCRTLDLVVPEQAIDVPKITQGRIQQRLVDRDLRQAQMAEQLVEMLEFVQFVSLLPRTEINSTAVCRAHRRHSSSAWSMGSSTSLSWRRGCLLGPGCSENHEIPHLQSIDRCRRHCWAGPTDSTCAVCVKTAEIPQLHASYSFLDKVVDMPVVFNDKCPYLSLQKTAKVPQSQRSF